MNKILFVLLMHISLCTYSQNIEIIKDDLPLYQGIIPSKGNDAKKIYGLLRQWVASNYVSAKDVIQLDDQENGKLILKGVDKYFINVMNIKVENICFHTITLETKQEKFRYTIEITDVTTGTLNQSILNDVLLTDQPVKSNGKPYTGNILEGLLKQKEQHLSHISTLKSNLINSLSKITDIKKDDW